MSTRFKTGHPQGSPDDDAVEIRNQAVRDPTPAEIRERSAEVRRTWSETRWRKERRQFRPRGWTVPEVSVASSLLEATTA